MFAKAEHSLCLLLVTVVVTSNGWVFTDVDYADVAAKMYGVERSVIDDEETNDIELRNLKFALIYPGTKWCGAGNIADSYDDLGSSKEADICCRDHDNCADIIPAGETKYNLTNTAFYTRLNCACDEQFQSCLHEAGTSTARRIGTIYFNALDSKCYRKEYPVKACVKKGGWFNRKCVEYSYYTDRDQVYQWFDLPSF